MRIGSDEGDQGWRDKPKDGNREREEEQYEVPLIDEGGLSAEQGDEVNGNEEPLRKCTIPS